MSVNTVSRALAGKDNVSEETRSRIKEVASRLGYVPNALARSLVTGSAMTIGLLLTNPSNPTYAGLITTIEERARRRGYSLLIATSQENQRREAESIDTLLKWRVDGLTIIPAGGTTEPVKALAASGVPFVLMLRDLPEVEADFVSSDNRVGAREAARHLIGQGHRRIAMLARDIQVPSNQERIAGFREAMEEAHIPVDERLILSISSVPIPGGHAATLWSPEGAYEICSSLIRRPDRPTAIFLTQDFFAIGAYRAIHEAGLRIPEDMAVVGYGDSAFARFLTPSLTSVSIPAEDIGRIAVDLLLRRLRRQAGVLPRKILLPAQLVVRDSSRFAKAAERQQR